MKLITFCVPCFNSQDYMRHCLDCLLQGGEDVEIIVVDDGSKDNTGKIADEYQAAHPSIVRVVHKANGGHGSGVNKGVELATGLYYKVVDSDDWLDDEGYKKLLDTIKEHQKANTLPDLYIMDFVYNKPSENSQFERNFRSQFPVGKIFTWKETKPFKGDKVFLMHAKGDVLQGKTFTVDPITKHRLSNRGESDQFYISHHHQPIISEADFDAANKIRTARSYNRILDPNGARMRFSRQYTFSSILECGFCHKTLVRRKWSGGYKYHVDIWQCLGYSRSGKSQCRHSKGIPESTIENAFVEAYNAIVSKDSSFVEEFLQDYEEVLAKGSVKEQLSDVTKKLNAAKSRMNRLADLYMNNAIEKDSYNEQYTPLALEAKRLTTIKNQLDLRGAEQGALEQRIKDFKEAIGEGKGKPLEKFSKAVFETCIAKVIIGGEDQDHVPNPYKMTFVFKNGFKNALGIKDESHVVPAEPGEPADHPEKYVTLKKFNMFWRHTMFMPCGEDERRKVISDFIPIEIVLDLG
jgi:glycosyltransferase involved in cell wall biosynthesis